VAWVEDVLVHVEPYEPHGAAQQLETTPSETAKNKVDG